MPVRTDGQAGRHQTEAHGGPVERRPVAHRVGEHAAPGCSDNDHRPVARPPRGAQAYRPKREQRQRRTGDLAGRVDQDCPRRGQQRDQTTGKRRTRGLSNGVALIEPGVGAGEQPRRHEAREKRLRSGVIGQRRRPEHDHERDQDDKRQVMRHPQRRDSDEQNAAQKSVVTNIGRRRARSTNTPTNTPNSRYGSHRAALTRPTSAAPPPNVSTTSTWMASVVM
jgi:hypothetical protein